MPGRMVSVDALRGLAAILMILWHFLTWTSLKLPSILDIGGMSFGWPVSATMFFMVTGVSLYLATSRRLQLGQTRGRIRRHVAKRYCLLILLGLALNVLLSGPRRIWRWDVLESIGACNLLAYFLLERGVKMVGLAAASVAVFGVTAMQPGLDILQTTPVNNVLFTGMFPLFPWLSLVIGGVMLGRFAAAAQLKVVHRPMLLLAVMATPMIVAGVAFAAADSVKNRLLLHIVISAGITLLAFSLFLFLEDRIAWSLTPFAVPGRVALGIYVWHLLVVCMAIRFLGLVNAISFPTSLVVSLVLTSLFVLASAIWLKTRSRTLSALARLVRSI